MRVVIAEDLALLREGIASLLKDEGMRWWRRLATPTGCWRRLPRSGPTSRSSTCGCRRPRPDKGVRTAIELRRRQPEVAILILCQYLEERYATDLLSSGSRGIG